ncbi:MAG: hypothetical protein HYR85_16435, partial [Planctomycetes bacterium]|nr:hypothetical protein [Planctomycetota bacterium]
PDPLRTRVHFLSALPAARRDAFFNEAIGQLRRHLAALAGSDAPDEDDRRAHEGGMIATRARIAWLEKLRRRTARAARR